MRPNVLKAWRVAKMGKGVIPQPKAAPVPAPLPEDPMRLTRAALVEIANAHGLTVEDDETKREIVEALNG
jgi:hypothetical protein